VGDRWATYGMGSVSRGVAPSTKAERGPVRSKRPGTRPANEKKFKYSKPVRPREKSIEAVEKISQVRILIQKRRQERCVFPGKKGRAAGRIRPDRHTRRSRNPSKEATVQPVPKKGGLLSPCTKPATMKMQSEWEKRHPFSGGGRGLGGGGSRLG